MNTDTSTTNGTPAAVARYLKTFRIATVCLVALPVGLNAFVNPYLYYPTSLFRPVTWSTRPLRTVALRSCQGTGAVIIGSSRAMKLAPSRVEKRTGLRSYNASVDSAMAEDYLALYRLAHLGCGDGLQEIVLGIDLESFHDTHGPDGRVTGAPDYWLQLPWEERIRSALDALEKLVAWEQTVQSLRSVRLAFEQPPVATSSFDADGLFHNLSWEKEKAEGTFKLDAKGMIGPYLSRFAGYRHVSPRRREIFEQFLAEASAAGIRVRAFVTPLHSEVQDALRASRGFDERRGELMSWLGRLAAENHSFSVVDYSDVRAFGGTERGFYDGAHIDDENSDRLLDALYGARADALQ